jgi:osmoprotectant transport system substrate-binding protein
MRARSLLALLAVLAPALGLAACSSGTPDRASGGPRVVIVGQSFTEADVVSQLYRALLDSAGFSATVRPLGGRDLYLGPLERGQVQVAADTLSSTAEALNHRAEGDAAVPVSSPDPSVALDRLTRLASPVGLTPLRPTSAQLRAEYAVTKAFAARFGLETLSDLGRLHRRVALAASSDCDERPDCADGLATVYGIRLAKVGPLGSGTADTEAALVNGQVQLAQVASTDGAVGHGLVLLDDDRQLLDAENVVPVVNTAWLHRHERAREVLDRLGGVLTTDDLRTLTASVNAGQSARSAARAYLEGKDLLPNSR